MTEKELFDRHKLWNLIGQLQNVPISKNFDGHGTARVHDELIDFLQSECRRNRVEAVREVLEKVRPKQDDNPYREHETDTTTYLRIGWSQNCATVNSKIEEALSKLEREGKREG